MANSKETLGVIDAQISAALGAAGLVDEMVYKGTAVPGYFSKTFVEQGDDEETVAGFMVVFDCREEDLPSMPARGDIVEVTGQAKYRVIRSEPDGTGRRGIILGALL